MKNAPIPTGTKDILPPEAAELKDMESRMRGVFESFGYREVITPSLEKESVMEAAGEQRFKDSFRFFDERGDVLMLRPEMTTPIARLIATKLADREPPFRLSYFANSFRPAEPQRGRYSEFFQAGLELVGIESAAVDAEVLTVLCRSLEACGLDDFAVALGESTFIGALLQGAGVPEDGRAAVFAALAARDLVRLDEIVGSLDISEDDRESVAAVTRLRGGSEILVEAQDLVRSPAMEEALKRLARTYYLVSRHGYGSRIMFDLGILRSFEYYTGIVFEVLSGELGFPIGGGGRYDGLLGRFGRPMPAVGFAVGLDRLHIAINAGGGITAEAPAAVALIGGLDDQLGLAAELRDRGVRVMALPESMEAARAGEVAAADDIGLVVAGESAGEAGKDNAASFRLLAVATGEERTLSRDELIDTLLAPA